VNSLRFAALAFLALMTAAQAQTGHYPQPATPAEIKAAVDRLGATHTTHLVQNRADCAPDLADPVWGPQEQFLGFSCYRQPSNR
jgi:hypothetical protein